MTCAGGLDQVPRLRCEVSAESILDYGQYVILSTGNFLCSAPSLNSTMDFSRKPIEDGVVDSPPERAIGEFSVMEVTRTMSATDVCPPALPLSPILRLMRRKVYGDANYTNAAPGDSHAILSQSALLSGNGGCCTVTSTLQSLKRKRDI